jgi:hypothetical protein
MSTETKTKIKKDTPFVMRQYIAPKTMVVNNKPSPCECEDRVICAYCVQANLLAMDKKFKADEKTADNIIAFIKRNGIRKTARDLGVVDSNVRYWLKTKNVPQWVIIKYAGCANQ